jgi:Protein of unknown function (DUF998)
VEIINRREQVNIRDAHTVLTRVLLACGVLVAPLFFAVALVEILIRPAFDIRRMAISSLTLGDLGWIQILNFEITGLLMIACAFGVRRALRGRRGGAWAPILLGVAGAGTIVAGIFHPDPALGFPQGAPAGMPATMSAQATVHQIASMATFACTIATCFVLARKFAGDGRRVWMTYCLASGLVAPVLLVLALGDRDWVGVLLAAMVAVAFGCVSAVVARLRADEQRA